MRRTLSAYFIVCTVACVVALTSFATYVIRHHLLHSPTRLGQAAPSATTPAAASNTRVLAAYKKLPLGFEPNQGQTDARVQFLTRGSGYTVFLTDQEATLRLNVAEDKSHRALAGPSAGAETSHSVALRFALDRSNPHPNVHALEVQAGQSNYFVGNDPAKWHKNIPQFARVKYDGVYPGVDLVYYGNQGRLESDYIVAPGADTQQIALRIEGADELKLNATGDAVISTTGGEISLHRPRAYQESNGERREIAANYVRHGSRALGIHVGQYDPQQPLIIDPVVEYATFLGGTGVQFTNGLAVDSAGNTYLVGSTSATDFPVSATAFQKVSNDPSTGNAFVAKLNSTGTALVFATYLGGSGTTGRFDVAEAVVVDATGNVYVGGSTVSTDFPIVAGSAFQLANKGIPVNAYLSKLDPTGSTLLYSTYLGGSDGDDYCNALALDSNANVYLTGLASSTNFPTTAATAIQTTGKSFGSAYVSRIDTTKSGVASLVYSTLLGGSLGDSGNGIAVDSTFNAYITGPTASSDFPITASTAFQSALKGASSNGFVAEIDTTTANHLVYSSYFGGTTIKNAGEYGKAIALDPNFNAYVIGAARSSDFPVTAGTIQTTPPNASQTNFVARFDTTKSKAASLVYSTFLGGSSFDGPGSIAVDTLGDAYVTGFTDSPDFPTLPGAPQPTRTTFNRDIVYVSILDPTGSSLLFSTYYGGNNFDRGNGIGLDSSTNPNVYVAGDTGSADFPTTPGAFQTTLKGASGFVLKLSPAAAVGVFTAPVSLSFGNQTINTASAPQTVTLANLTKSTLNINGISFTGTNSADFSQTATTCGATLAHLATCTISVAFKPSTTAAESATLSIANSDASSPQTVPLSGTGTVAPSLIVVSPNSLSFGTSPQAVTLTNNGSSALTITGVTITGANAADFQQTNTCGASVAAGANCSISVTFTSSTTAAESATLNIADSDVSSPQTVALTAPSSVPDFTIAAVPPSVSVTAGSTGTFAVGASSQNNFAGTIAFTCTGAPVDASCTLAPTSVSLAAGALASTTASVATTTRTIAPPTSFRRIPGYPSGMGAWTAIGFLLFVFWVAKRRGLRKLAWSLAAVALFAVTSCSGVPHRGTPAGSYTLTVTATSGSLTHSTTVSLSVN